ncbi:MAG: hypothetical protein MUE32_06640 [Bacteroidales bacterium]|jgi:hypothetical protein|nr:hypothetical protein [Bacteroidales bacterium]
MKIAALVSLTLLILAKGCFFFGNDDYDFTYETLITDIPANLEKLNTKYDDYNSDLPFRAMRQTICFSTNRNTGGYNYDLIIKDIDISYHEKDDALDFSVPENSGKTSYETKLINLITNDKNEMGPMSVTGDAENYGGEWEYFMYAGDAGGNFDIMFTYTLRMDWGVYQAKERLYGPLKADAINSASDDMYPALNRDRSAIYFCSNRDGGKFDIYSMQLHPSLPFQDFLASPGYGPVTKETTLSGTSNDKCPSITRNLLVFTSDRPGGYGGYDLYYSTYTGNGWSLPVNFGTKINSEYDEYRPITFSFNGFDLMIFSSNRTGGKGCFDLYAVKIPDLLDDIQFD